MTLPMAAWRVTYTPGNWLVLAGPTMLVVMLPAPASASRLVGDLWSDIVSAESVDGLLALAGEVGLDAMPDFGAFFWDATGLHGLSRGRVRVVDTDTAEVVLDGEGTITWNEANLGGDRHLRIDLEPVNDDDVLQLPLVVGAASVSAIYLTTEADSLVRFPSYEQLGVLPKIPVLGIRPRQRAAEPVVAAAPVGDPTEGPPAPESAVDPALAAGHAELASVQQPEPLVEDADASDDLDNPTLTGAARALEPEPTEPEPEPALPTADGVPEEVPQFPGLGDEFGSDDSTDPGSVAAPVAAEMPGLPVVPGTPAIAGAAAVPIDLPGAAQRPAPVVIPPKLGEIDDDAGGTIFSTGLAATHKPARQGGEQPDPQVLAVPCSNGHPNAPGSRACRICKAQVDSSNPRLIRRPLLAAVHTNQGDFVDVAEGVVIGRAPDAGKGPGGAYLLRVPSPSSDISRNHLLVTTRDWGIHVTDLHSTNGTAVLPVGEPPFTLRDGASVQVELGTVLDLGDGVSLRIEPPRG